MVSRDATTAMVRVATTTAVARIGESSARRVRAPSRVTMHAGVSYSRTNLTVVGWGVF